MDSTRAVLDLDGLRHRNETWLAGFIAALTGAMLVGSVPRVLLVADGAATAEIALIAGFHAVYLLAWLILRAGWTRGSAETAWIATALEVSVASVALVLDAVWDAEFALKNVPVALYVIAIFASVARLRPGLAAFAGLLAASEWMSLYYAVAMSRELVDPALQAPMAWQRGVLFILCGVLAERFTHVMSRMVYDVQETTAEADRIRRAFGAYVADPVVHRVLSGDLRLTTERRHATVLFVDIRNFTATTAGLPADLVLSRLNLALDRFSRQVLRKRGIVNKFLGDGMLALFGAPEDDPMHVQHAFEAARAILVEADRLRLTGEYPALQVGIGMATGEVLVGDVGGASQREYTAIGATVNLAARLEQRTKDLGVPLLLCGRVARALGPHAAIRRLPPIRVRGVPGEVGVWTVDAPDAEAMSHAEVSGHWGMTLDAIPELSEEHDRRRSTQEVPAARGPAPPVAMRRPR